MMMLQNTVPQVASLMFMNELLVLCFWFQKVEIGREASKTVFDPIGFGKPKDTGVRSL